MYVKANLLSVLALLGVTSALPNGWKPTPTSTEASPTPTPSYNEFEYDATFDDISDTVNGVTDALTFVGVYKSLYYQSFNLVATTNTDVAGVIPNSQANYAAFGEQSSLVQGTPQITANYDGSTIEFFHLKSFYYACQVITETGIAGVPASCTITIQGYDIHNNTVAGPQTFTYQASGALQQMSPALVESSFQTNQVYRIVFSYESLLINGLDGGVTSGVVQPGMTNAIVGAFIDTAVYDVFGTGGLPGNSK